jgi:hypothetical protein
MEYMVRFIGHIDENKRPDDFPKEIYSDVFYEVNDLKSLRDSIKQMYQIFAAQQCMLVPKDQNVIQNDESRFNYDTLMYVPLHMITRITTDSKRLSGEVPTIDENGQAKLKDGTKVWRQ